MQAHFPQSATALSEPLTNRASISVSVTPRAFSSRVLALWSKYLERRGNLRGLDGLPDMDAHMLRDIGAPGPLVARAVDRANEYRRRLNELYPSRQSIR